MKDTAQWGRYMGLALRLKHPAWAKDLRTERLIVQVTHWKSGLSH